MICPQCEVLVGLVREIAAVCARNSVTAEERTRRLRWATESFEMCCVGIDFEAIEPVVPMPVRPDA